MKPPIYRYLRGYSLDPGFSTRLDTAVPDMVALIPVHKQDGNVKKKNGWKMPA